VAVQVPPGGRPPDVVPEMVAVGFAKISHWSEKEPEKLWGQSADRVIITVLLALV
jgi:hypothetical protein